MIYELFKHLPLKDLVACSMVNKRWHFIYSNLRLHSLAATDFDDLFRWYQSNLPIQDAERCPQFVFLRLAEKPLLSNLKHLAVSGSFEFDLNKLNRFQQLLHLEINITLRNKKLHLNLPRLKVLVLHRWNDYCALSIDCPQLITLLYDEEPKGATLLKVKHPETIRTLETNMFDAKLIPFKAVECLVTGRFEAISKATLISLPELRELHYDWHIEFVIAVGSRHGPGTVDRMKQKLNEFLDEAKKLRGNEFQFTFCGFRLTNVNVDQIDFGVQVHEESRREYVHNEYVYMKNYHLVEPGAIDFVRYVYYTDLLSHVTGEFPRCFSQKFTDIRSVYATTKKVQDPDHFLWFLKSLRFLIELWLEDTELAQEFYDHLPASASSLIRLNLRDEHCEKGLQLNFDFIGSFSYLSELVINSIISLELLPSLVRSVGRLELGWFDVQSREKIFKIYKGLRSTEWTIKRDGESLFETEDPEEIVDFFDGLQGTREKCSI